MNENSRRHEEEIALRLQFEGRLNKIHSYQRDTEERYKRAVEEIDMFTQNINAQNVYIHAQKEKYEEYD